MGTEALLLHRIVQQEGRSARSNEIKLVRALFKMAYGSKRARGERKACARIELGIKQPIALPARLEQPQSPVSRGEAKALHTGQRLSIKGTGGLDSPRGR